MLSADLLLRQVQRVRFVVEKNGEAYQV